MTVPDDEKARGSKRQRRENPNPPPPIPEVDLSAFDGLDRISDDTWKIIEEQVTELVDEVQGIMTDPTWEQYLRGLPSAESLVGVVDHYRAAQRQNLVPPAVVNASKQAAKSTVTQTGAAKAVRTDRDLALVDNTYVGMWGESGFASGPTPKDAVTDLVLLNQLSQLLINKIKTVEIESMTVNGRIFISANERNVVESLCQQTLAEWVQAQERGNASEWAASRGRRAEDMHAVISGEDNERGTRDLVNIGVASNLFPAQAELVRAQLATLNNAHLAIIDGGTPDAASAYVADDNYTGRIITVLGLQTGGMNPTNCSHAEQNLVLALVKSGYTGEASIAGGKRPCLVCFVSLSLAQRNGFPGLRFDTRPGGYWEGTTKKGVWSIASALALSQEEFDKQVKEILNGVGQHVTDVSDDAAERTAIADLREAVRRSTYKTDVPTPPQSPRYDSEDYREYEPSEATDDEMEMSDVDENQEDDEDDEHSGIDDGDVEMRDPGEAQEDYDLSSQGEQYP